MSKEVASRLEAALGSLNPTHRELILLRDVEGMTAPEVADTLGISVSAVKSRLHRARAELKRAFTPEPSPPPGPDCPDVLDLFSRYLENEINAQVCAEMQQHLRQCDRCRGLCDGMKSTLNTCQLTAYAVPKAVQSDLRDAIRRALGQAD